MRLLALFFAFYFAGLACLTCADEVAGCAAEQQTTVAATPHADCRATAPADWCSPLCQCQCCGATVVLPLEARVEPPLPAEWTGRTHPTQLLGAVPTQARGAVWQPPQA